MAPVSYTHLQRIYGYVEKAHVTPAQVRAMEERIRPFVEGREQA